MTLSQEQMAVAKSPDKIRFLYTEHTDNTVSSVKMTEKLRPLREIRVPMSFKSGLCNSHVQEHSEDFKTETFVLK